MNLRLSYKLLISFGGLVLIILAASLLLSRWSFVEGFRDYGNGVALTRLEGIAPLLAERYVTLDAGWSELSAEEFDQVIRSWRPLDALAGIPPAPSIGGMGEPPPGMGPPPPGATPPPPGTFPPPGMALRLPPGVRPGSLPQASNVVRPPPPVYLFDENGKLVDYGLPVQPSGLMELSVPIAVDGLQVGLLRSYTRPNQDYPLETSIAAQQRIVSFSVVAFFLAVSLYATVVLARMVIVPIRRMRDGVRRMAEGEYDARLSENRRDELGELASDIDSLARTLEANRSSRRRWFADISHELRTPASILKAELEAVKLGVMELDTRQLESFEQEVSRMNLLIEDLAELSYSDLGALRYKFDRRNLNELVDQTVRSKRDRARELGFSLTFDDRIEALVAVDIQRIDQLISNLIENSFAHTDSPGKIEIKLEKDRENARIVVQDSAPDVPAEHLEHLFEPLYQTDRTKNGQRKAAGLGLAICRNIVTAHHGDIAASDSPLGGLRISITLPLANE